VPLPARVLALLVPALLLIGCTGGDEEPAPPAPSVDVAAIREGLVALWVGDDESPDETAAGECFAGELTDRATADELRDAGILDDSYAVLSELPSFDRDGAELWVDAQFACVDFVSESARAQVAATKGKVDAAAYEACLRDSLTDDQLREAAIQSVMGDLGGDAVSAFSQAQLTCVQQTLPPD